METNRRAPARKTYEDRVFLQKALRDYQVVEDDAQDVETVRIAQGIAGGYEETAQRRGR